MFLPVLTSLALAQSARDAIAPLGTDQLASVRRLSFTFNVERDGAPVRARAWTWEPASGRVTRTVDGVTLAFTMGQPQTEDEKKADAQFVNDTFWLAPQLHVRWAGPDLTVTDAGPATLPIGEGSARKVVLQYAPTGGGYTPGDAYDLFLDDAGRIVAWIYRQGGAPEPSITATFADYVTVGPLTLATDHRTPDGLRIHFTGVAIE